MANWQINTLIKKRQIRVLMTVVSLGLLGTGIIISLLVNAHPKPTQKTGKPYDMTGIVDESFTQTVGDKALINQQTELESLKKQVVELTDTFKAMKKKHRKELVAQKEELISQVNALVKSNQETMKTVSDGASKALGDTQNPQLWHNPNVYALNERAGSVSDATLAINSVSFRPPRLRSRGIHKNYLNPAHYVPSNTSVRAVVLGGADADASVNGQSKNNGVMLFKFLEDGTLPNSARSHLKGCRVSAYAYGDISSERAFASLYKLSCAHHGKPIIDKEVTGWVFFNGKVGIKGVPLMRDNKVMTWAGVSGALSGIAQAAQYAQSVQAVGPFGAASVIPSSQVGPYAAYGGASKAADTLSQYYVKRAEQYHPVIQVGSANKVTIVFKDGFYLDPDEHQQQYVKNQLKAEEESRQLIAADETNPTDMNFTVPDEVLGKIDRVNAASHNNKGDLG